VSSQDFTALSGCWIIVLTCTTHARILALAESDKQGPWPGAEVLISRGWRDGTAISPDNRQRPGTGRCFRFEPVEGALMAPHFSYRIAAVRPGCAGAR
jgi:hypothetical protein